MKGRRWFLNMPGMVLFSFMLYSQDAPKLAGPVLCQKPPGKPSRIGADDNSSANKDRDFVLPQLFIIGGFNEKQTYADVYSISILDLLSGEGKAWTRGPALPHPLQGHTAVTVRNRIFIIGGLQGVDENRRAIYSQGVFSAEVNDSRLGEWKRENPLPQPLAYHAAVRYKDFIMICGGQSPATISTVYKAPVAENGKIGGWEIAGALPKPMRGHAAVIVNDRLFILGGHDDGGFFAEVHSAPIGGDGRIGKWESAMPLPAPLVHFGVAEHNGRIYVFGGQDAGDNLHTEIYSAKSSGSKLANWRFETAFPFPQSRMGLIIIDEHIIATGGGFGWAPPVYSDVLASELDQDGVLGKWRKIGDLPGPIAFHAAVIVPERRHP